tara:strand:+ start:392 stop:574 length:183 start_codon:yes stop_codon:yes gene_type:complete
MAYPTNPIYKFVKDPISGKDYSLMFNDNGQVWNIPMSTDNRMYNDYLEWVAEGNTPEAAD